MPKRISRPSPALAISLVALFVALGGTGYAAVTINGKNIKNGTVTAKKIKNKTLTGAKIKNKTLTGAKLKNNTIGAGQINEAKLGVVPTAANATTATNAENAKKADTVKGSHGKLAVGEERTVLSHGPLSVLARCADTDANPVNIELMFYIASTEPGSWFASWNDGSLDFGPGTPLDERELNSANWLQDAAGGPFDYDNPADAAVSAAAPGGAGFNAFPGGTVQFETGCNYAITANVTG